MQRRQFVLGLLPTALLPTARLDSYKRQPHVVFLDPGEPVERGTGPYGRLVTQIRHTAARSLDLHPEVLYLPERSGRSSRWPPSSW